MAPNFKGGGTVPGASRKAEAVTSVVQPDSHEEQVWQAQPTWGTFFACGTPTSPVRPLPSCSSFSSRGFHRALRILLISALQLMRSKFYLCSCK